MKKWSSVFPQLILGFVVVLFTIWGIQNGTDAETAVADNLLSPVAQSQDTAAHTPSAGATNCRYGVSSWNSNDYTFIQDLGVGWVLNFGVNFPTLPSGVEYTPMVRFKPQLDGNGNRTGNYRVITQQFNDSAGGLGPVIAAHPGALWLIGNEIERVQIQDDLMPSTYAKAYHDAYYFIKARDPSAQIAISGLVEITPARLQYLDLVLSSYQAQYGKTMPVDVWNFHVYILPEKQKNVSNDRVCVPSDPYCKINSSAAIALGTDPAIAIFDHSGGSCSASNVYCYADHDNMDMFKQQIIDMRQWMKNHGQQDKPLILSEFSLLLPYNQEGDSDPNTCYLMDENGKCFTPERVSAFMQASFDYLQGATDASLGLPNDNNRLVQQWLWFTVYDGSGTFSSDLLEQPATATGYVTRLPGRTFKAKMDALSPSAHPFLHEVSHPVAHTAVPPTGTTSVNLSATLYNNGDTATTAGTTVEFYSDAAGTTLIGTAVMPAGLSGCVRRTGQTGDLVWSGLGTGKHSYWAKVSGSSSMMEGFALINPEQVFLPIILN